MQRRSTKRKETAERRTRNGSQDATSEWKAKERRHASSRAVHETAPSKKSKEEQKYLAVDGSSNVFSTYDAMFLLSKYLLQLQEAGSLPLDVYAIRRGLSSHFKGPKRLRLNIVCNVQVIAAILRHLSMDDARDQNQDANEETESRVRRSRKGETDNNRNTNNEGNDNKDNVRKEEKSELPEDDDGNLNDGKTAENGIDHQKVKSETDRKPISPLDAYFNQLKEPDDQSFRELNFEGSLVDLDVKDGILYLTKVQTPLLRKALLRNRKKERIIDLGDSMSSTEVVEDTPHSDVDVKVEEAATGDHSSADSKETQSEDFSHTDIDALYKSLYQNTARELARLSEFQLKEHSGFREICEFGTRAECRLNNRMSLLCYKVHFKRIILPNTLVQLGDCSYLDTCRHIETCRFVHYQVENDIPPRPIVDEVSGGQWICCDVRKLDFSIFNPHVAVVMADPPWDIHMDLPYGTMKDSEMKNLKVQNIQNEGLLFLWVTGRTLEVGRECMEIWGYRQVDEIVWVKTNQLQRIIRTGRTGHWLNHSKEHCLIGIKGNPVINRYIDCDVVVSEVRETSRKPDEIYRLIERMVPGALKLEIFGRSHNVRNNWITLGNQLDGYHLTHPEIKRRYEELVADTATSAPATAVETPRAGTTNDVTTTIE